MSGPLPDDPVVSLRCYDPAGAMIHFSREELLSHTLVIGATGAGKTSRLMLPMFDDLCRSRSGLLVIDAKGDDDYRDAIARSARRHGRQMVEIDGGGQLGFDPFRPMRRKGLDGVREVAEILCASAPVDDRNRYWDVVFRHIFENALRILQLTQPDFGYGEAIGWLREYLVSFSPRSAEVSKRIDRLRDARTEATDPEAAERLDDAISSHEMWESLDYRTRSIHQSLAVSVVEPLQGDLARRYFAPEETVDLAEALSEEKVALVRLSGFGERGFGRLLCCSVKALFFRSLIERARSDVPWGLLVDDWTLSISGGFESSSSEVAALPLIRSKGGFLVAACQSFAAIDEIVGARGRASAVANFGNLLFLRGRDVEADLLAWRTFAVPDKEVGEIWRSAGPPGASEQAWTVVRRVEGSLAPIGKLSRLATGEAMVSVCGRVQEQPVLLAPHYEQSQAWEASNEAD